MDLTGVHRETVAVMDDHPGRITGPHVPHPVFQPGRCCQESLDGRIRIVRVLVQFRSEQGDGRLGVSLVPKTGS